MSNQTTTNPLPASFISKEEMNSRVNNYMTTKHSILSAALGTDETKAIWYAMPHLEQLIDELRYKEASGMRIYFGAYSPDHENFPGQLCLVMVPTRANAQTQGHTDIIAEEEADFWDRAGTYDPSEIERIYKTFNFGSPCPPACGLEPLTFPY
jgi:hypothetical protein